MRGHETLACRMTSGGRGLISRGAGSKRKRGDGRSIQAVGGSARDVLLIGGNRDQRRKHGGLDLRNACRECAQADQPAALPVGTLAVGGFRMLVAGAVGVNVRLATVMLMNVMDVSRPKAVIIISETVHDARTNRRWQMRRREPIRKAGRAGRLRSPPAISPLWSAT
jgi:hypothetical protein